MAYSRYKVIYSPAAYKDLDAIVLYIVTHFKDKRAAKSLADEIRIKIKSLSDMPERYALVDWEPWASMNIHRFPVRNYVVFYSVNHDRKLVTVVRIFYSGQDIENIIKEFDR